MTEPRREIQVVTDRDRPSAFMLKVDGTDQSYVDLDDPMRLEFDYVQRMADAIDGHGLEGEPLRCVHVGGAGMTLPRYVAATRPRSPQIVLEPDEEVTALVREQMPLPRHSGIKVRPVDGRSGVAAMRDDFADVVVVDAFDGDRVPADLTTREFYADLARVTTPDGLVLLNLAEPSAIDIAPWSDRVQYVDAKYPGKWELPVLGEVAAPPAVLIRPDGYVAWVGDGTLRGLTEALTTWFGTPAKR